MMLIVVNSQKCLMCNSNTYFHNFLLSFGPVVNKENERSDADIWILSDVSFTESSRQRFSLNDGWSCGVDAI